MKKTISTNRLTIDLTDENKSLLEKLKLSMQKPFGQIVNQTLSTVCDAPASVKEETLAFYKRQINALYIQMDKHNVSPFELQALFEKAQAYINLSMLMNDGKYIGIDDIRNEPYMVRYEIEGGYVICPEDWIVVNPEMARQCHYAGVVECRRANYHMPHFLFFTNKTSREYDNTLYNEVNEACCKAWEGFRDILSKQVEPINDKNGHTLNIEEWDAAPTLGYFALYEQGDPKLPPGFKFPMGSMIVRNNKQH